METSPESTPASSFGIPTEAAPEVSPHPVVTSIRRILTVFAVGGTVTASGSYLGSVHWFFDLWTHFRFQYMVFFGLVALVFIAWRSWKVAGVAAALCLMNAGAVLPVYFGEVPAEATRPVARVLSINLLTSNTDYQAVRDLVEREKPDILLLMEVNERWKKELADLETEFVDALWSTRSDNFGIALMSRRPCASLKEVVYVLGGVPSIEAVIDDPIHGAVRVIGTHPLPPVGSLYAGERNQQFDRIAESIAEDDRPTILIGDLNCTPWSPYFSRLLERSGLRDSRQGFGNQPTWPTGRWVLRIPIDHCLVSEHFVTTRRDVLPSVGSDHFPLLVEVGVRK
jgi:endonuclease/exonuclease/phosphatase (EEP) superfamily protein YafD